MLSKDSVIDLKAELENLTSSVISSFPSNEVVCENVEAVRIDSYKVFKNIDNQIKSYNKQNKQRIKLRGMLHKSESARKMVQAKKYFFVAVDVESYERDHSYILEVGWSMYNSKTDLYMDRHFCVEENRHLRNGQYVPDMKDRFNFGKTVWADQESIKDEFIKDLTDDDVKGRVIIVGHDIDMDIKYLSDMGVEINELTMNQFDTAEMNAARIGKAHERTSLGRSLDQLDIENYCLHNAGEVAFHNCY